MSRTCGYCQIFRTARARNLLSTDKPNERISSRVCFLNRKEVTSDTKACGEIKRADRFWCEKSGHWMDSLVCIHRQRKKICRCRQGRVILSLSRKPLGTQNENKNNQSNNMPNKKRRRL